MHRSGRTARAKKEGLSVMLVGPEDLKNYRKIIKTLNKGPYIIEGKRSYISVSRVNPYIHCVQTLWVLFVIADEDLPVFPTEMDTLTNMKPKVQLARQIDKEVHQ